MEITLKDNELVVLCEVVNFYTTKKDDVTYIVFESERDYIKYTNMYRLSDIKEIYFVENA